MSTTPASAKRDLLKQIEAALETSPSGQNLVDLIIRSGWQPRPTPDPNSDYLEGVLLDGTRVPIEIRHRQFSRAS